MATGTTPGMGLLAGILGGVVGAAIGNQFHPLPNGWQRSRGRARNIAIAKTVAVGSIYGGVGAAIGYALTGCDCCPSAGGLGTPLQVPVTPPATDLGLPPGTPK